MGSCCSGDHIADNRIHTDITTCNVKEPQQKYRFGTHLSVITFLAIMLFAAGILGFVFVGELEDSVRGSLMKSVKENYGLPGKESITASWDTVQQRGCYDQLEGYLTQNGILIGTAAVVVGVFMILEIIASIIMYRSLP